MAGWWSAVIAVIAVVGATGVVALVWTVTSRPRLATPSARGGPAGAMDDHLRSVEAFLDDRDRRGFGTAGCLFTFTVGLGLVFGVPALAMYGVIAGDEDHQALASAATACAALIPFLLVSVDRATRVAWDHRLHAHHAPIDESSDAFRSQMADLASVDELAEALGEVMRVLDAAVASRAPLPVEELILAAEEELRAVLSVTTIPHDRWAAVVFFKMRDLCPLDPAVTVLAEHLVELVQADHPNPWVAVDVRTEAAPDEYRRSAVDDIRARRNRSLAWNGPLAGLCVVIVVGRLADPNSHLGETLWLTLALLGGLLAFGAALSIAMGNLQAPSTLQVRSLGWGPVAAVIDGPLRGARAVDGAKSFSDANTLTHGGRYFQRRFTDVRGSIRVTRRGIDLWGARDRATQLRIPVTDIRSLEILISDPKVRGIRVITQGGRELSVRAKADEALMQALDEMGAMAARSK